VTKNSIRVYSGARSLFALHDNFKKKFFSTARKKRREAFMSQKNTVNGNAALRSDDDTMRVTASRGHYRPAARPQNIALVSSANGSGLLSKEEDCCSRATD
jgi:hypothetical protein